MRLRDALGSGGSAGGSHGRERSADGAGNSCGSSPAPARRSRYLEVSGGVIPTSQDLLGGHFMGFEVPEFMRYYLKPRKTIACIPLAAEPTDQTLAHTPTSI